MSVIWAIMVGFVVGLFARAIMPGKDPTGFIVTTLLGIGGSMVGKFLGQEFGLYRADESAGFFMSVVGAMILLLIYNMINRNKTTV